MYAILSEGQLIALCDKPRYVKIKEETGVYIESESKEDALALSVNGTLYNLIGKDNIPDAPEALVRDTSVSEYVFNNKIQINKNEAAAITIEDALCEQDSNIEERLAMIEDALCELDKEGAIKE